MNTFSDYWNSFLKSSYYQKINKNYDMYSKTNTYYNFDILCWYNP